MLPQIADKNKGPFMFGKSLHEYFILVRVSTKELRSKKINSVLVKLDITNSLETDNWQFLITTLMKIGSLLDG